MGNVFEVQADLGEVGKVFEVVERSRKVVFDPGARQVQFCCHLRADWYQKVVEQGGR